MEKALGIFQSRVARKIAGKQPWRRKDESWFYPSVAGVTKETKMVGIRGGTGRKKLIKKLKMKKKFVSCSYWSN